MNEQIYNFLKAKGYKFKEYPNKNAAKFPSYADAFNASMCIENSFIRASAGQHKNWLYFGKQVELPKDPEIGECIEVEEADEEDEEDEEDTSSKNVNFDSVMFAFSFSLHVSEIKSSVKIKKDKRIYTGDIDAIIEKFKTDFSEDIDKVNIIKKKNKVIFKKS